MFLRKKCCKYSSVHKRSTTSADNSLHPLHTLKIYRFISVRNQLLTRPSSNRGSIRLSLPLYLRPPVYVRMYKYHKKYCKISGKFDISACTEIKTNCSRITFDFNTLEFYQLNLMQKKYSECTFKCL